jgi:hypothetical protein
MNSTLHLAYVKQYWHMIMEWDAYQQDLFLSFLSKITYNSIHQHAKNCCNMSNTMPPLCQALVQVNQKW